MQQLNARLNFEKYTEFLKRTISNSCGGSTLICFVVYEGFPWWWPAMGYSGSEISLQRVGYYARLAYSVVLHWRYTVNGRGYAILSHHEGVWGNTLITQFAPNLGTIWKLVASLTPLPLYPRTRTPTLRQMWNRITLGFWKGRESHIPTEVRLLTAQFTLSVLNW